MEEDTILVLAGIGGLIYIANKSGLFDATQGAADAISGVGGGLGQIGAEIGQSVAAAVNPFQAVSARATEFIENVGRGSSRNKTGSAADTMRLATNPTGASSVSIPQSQVSTRLSSTVQSQIKNLNIGPTISKTPIDNSRYLKYIKIK